MCVNKTSCGVRCLFKFVCRNSIILMITSYQDEVLNQTSLLVCRLNDLPRGSYFMYGNCIPSFHSGNKVFGNEYLRSSECLLREQR